MWSDAPGARLLSYGDFAVEVAERGLTVGGTTLSLPASDARRLTDAHWHHLAVSYRDGTLTAYLDGAAFATAPKRLATSTAGELLAARIPAGANVVYDDLAVYPTAMSAARIAAHFDASGNARPLAPVDVKATGDTANALTVDWSPPPGTGPQGQRPIDSYVVEAWQGGTLRGAQAVDGDRRTATLSGLPAGAYEARVRAINGFSTGPDATAAATVTGAGTTYAGAVTDARPELYWRLGERSGSLPADASGHGHPAQLAAPGNQLTRAG